MGALGRGREQHRRRGGEKIRTMVLADAEHFEAHLVGEFDLFDQVAQPLRRIEDAPGRRVRGVFDERIDANFHWWAGIRLLGHRARTLQTVSKAAPAG